jgi:hypothetical protein
MLSAFRRLTSLALPVLAGSVLAGIAASGAGCGGAARGLDGGGVYRDERVAFRVGPIPPEWRAVRVDAANLAFRDETHRASVLVNARCGRKDQDTPLVSLTAHLLMGTTEREFASEETIPFDGREALHSRLTAKLDGVPLAYDVYVLKKDGCVYDFVHVSDRRQAKAQPQVPQAQASAPAPESAPAPNAAFDAFVQGFHTLSDGAP